MEKVNMTNEEHAVWIGERLFTTHHNGQIYDKHPYWSNYNKHAKNKNGWLSSPYGIAAVKERMIERGYGYKIRTSSVGIICEFALFIPDDGIDIYIEEIGATEAEAVLAACEKALKAEISEIL